MLDTNMKAQLSAYLQRFSQPVEIVASLDESKASGDMRALKDIAEASPLMKVSETQGGPHRTLSFSINRPGENHGLRFAGLPMGNEFTSLVLALLQIGGYPPKVDEAVLQQIRDHAIAPIKKIKWRRGVPSNRIVCLRFPSQCTKGAFYE